MLNDNQFSILFAHTGLVQLQLYYIYDYSCSSFYSYGCGSVYGPYLRSLEALLDVFILVAVPDGVVQREGRAAPLAGGDQAALARRPCPGLAAPFGLLLHKVYKHLGETRGLVGSRGTLTRFRLKAVHGFKTSSMKVSIRFELPYWFFFVFLNRCERS